VRAYAQHNGKLSQTVWQLATVANSRAAQCCQHTMQSNLHGKTRQCRRHIAAQQAAWTANGAIMMAVTAKSKISMRHHLVYRPAFAPLTTQHRIAHCYGTPTSNMQHTLDVRSSKAVATVAQLRNAVTSQT
jgi:hypothetical protein